MKLLAIDGNSILNRAFYGIKALTNKNGEYTNGIYGFMTILLKLLEEVKPEAVACAFDLSAPTFRHKMYDGYKAQRKGMPEELASQLAPLKELLGALGFAIVECEGFEADDILGTLSKAYSDQGESCVIATGDRDSLQLVGERVTVRLATSKMGQAVSTLYDQQAIQEKYGVTPHQLIDVKALMGDASDNIPGVAGIGEKTALSLIQKYHDLDTVYSQLDTLEVRPNVRSKLEAGKDMAYMSRKLAEICCQAPIDTRLDTYLRGKVDTQKAWSLFARLEMFSMREKWGLKEEDGTQPTEVPQGERVKLLCDPEDWETLVREAQRVDLLLDQEGQKVAVRVPGKLLLGDWSAWQEGLLKELPKTRAWSSKPLYKAACSIGQEVQLAAFDGELAAYLLSPNSSSYELSQLAAQYQVGSETLKEETLESLQELVKPALSLTPLLNRLEAEIQEKEQKKLLDEIEIPLAKVLAGMEQEGFALDTQALRAYGEEMDQRLEALQSGITLYAGYAFNINSPRQLGQVLFEELGLPAKKKTKTGYSTNAEVLEGLRGKHPIIDLILEYRKLSKLKSTYVEGLLKVVCPDGRVRSTFQQTETRTGRISSTEPNLQNIPVRTPEGSVLRKFFQARPGWKLVDADYSQIELRVLAHMAEDAQMIAAFQRGEDIHTRTAAQVMGLPEEMVTPQLRSQAKAVNFGIVYGIGAFSLSQDIGVTVSEADQYIKNYLNTYSGVKAYMDRTIQFAKEHGYVKTLFGRRRYLPELTASNKVTRAFGERVAMNTPIQGTAADIIKIAMVRVFQRLEQEKLRARLILQVHDELLVEAPEEEVEQVKTLLKEEMEGAIQLKVPLVAEAKVGDNWLAAK